MAWRFVNWEWRPAVTNGATAFAILAEGEGWTEVCSAEVGESGRPLDEADFRKMYPDLPPLPLDSSPPPTPREAFDEKLFATIERGDTVTIIDKRTGEKRTGVARCRIKGVGMWLLDEIIPHDTICIAIPDFNLVMVEKAKGEQ